MTPTDDTNWFSDEAATFGDRLAGAREAAGHTQDTLAKQLGVEVTSVDAWENDLREPRANRLQMLSGMLGVSLVWLLTGEGEGPEEPTEVLTDTPISPAFSNRCACCGQKCCGPHKTWGGLRKSCASCCGPKP